MGQRLSIAPSTLPPDKDDTPRMTLPISLSNHGRSAFSGPASGRRDFWFPSSAPAPAGDPWGAAGDDRSAHVGGRHPARWFEERWSQVSVIDQTKAHVIANGRMANP